MDSYAEPSSKETTSRSQDSEKLVGSDRHPTSKIPWKATTGRTTSRISRSSKTALMTMKHSPGEAAVREEGMIVVKIKNRLSAKADTVCSPSDTVCDFKKLAAMKLGVGAESIMLKRQGQRALKNAVTLGDSEIGNDSSLDLELDTGD